MKINSIQRDITLKQGTSGLRSDSHKFRESNVGADYNDRGYSAGYCGSFTSKSETAANAMKKGGVLTSKWFNKFLEMTFNHNIGTSALVALGLAGVMRPATIMALPGKKDKEDKIYASGQAMSSALLGFIASVILTSPLDTSIQKVFSKPDAFGSKKVAKIDRIKEALEKRANLRNEDGKIINRKSRELFKKMMNHRGNLNTLVKNIPDWIIAVPRSILTIALIPPILKYVFGVEKKKKTEPTKETAPMNNTSKQDFIDKPVFQQIKGGVK